ncbi:MAG: hypothetical protein ED557_14600 [Balneola sp.]|nr:MAG: hypothetical protein ED557_14600 [Balneola sp.]
MDYISLNHFENKREVELYSFINLVPLLLAWTIFVFTKMYFQYDALLILVFLSFYSVINPMLIFYMGSKLFAMKDRLVLKKRNKCSYILISEIKKIEIRKRPLGKDFYNSFIEILFLMTNNKKYTIRFEYSLYISNNKKLETFINMINKNYPKFKNIEHQNTIPTIDGKFSKVQLSLPYEYSDCSSDFD